MKKLFAIALLLGLLSACNTREIFEGPDSYADDFEAYAKIEDLVDGEDVRWSFFQNTEDQNSIAVDSTRAHSGQKSIRCASTDATRPEGVSKASINKQFMAFWEGEVVHVRFWIYVEGEAPADWLFIFDLEEKTNIGAGPGMRLALVDNHLALEHKYPNPNIFQPEDEALDFPRDQWVEVQFETLLSQKEEGYVRVWQDGQLVIEQENWQTLPRDILYFQQGTKGMYSQVEFGLTAISTQLPVVLYVDDVEVSTSTP